MENTLIDHLEEIQKTATKRLNIIIEDLKAKSNLTEDMKKFLSKSPNISNP